MLPLFNFDSNCWFRFLPSIWNVLLCWLEVSAFERVSTNQHFASNFERRVFIRLCYVCVCDLRSVISINTYVTCFYRKASQTRTSVSRFCQLHFDVPCIKFKNKLMIHLLGYNRLKTSKILLNAAWNRVCWSLISNMELNSIESLCITIFVK